MPIIADWLDEEHTTINMCFNGTWTDEQLQLALEAVHVLHFQAPRTKHHIITNFTQAPIISARSLQSITTVLDRVRPWRSHYGLIIFVGASRLLRIFGKLLNDTEDSNASNVYYVDTVVDAVKIIGETVARTYPSGETIRRKMQQTLSRRDDPDATQPPNQKDQGTVSR
ncbi:MAG: hypothetical protein KC708_05360 [Anaerolineae bacterium]|nr:hypothetical protein [Anaerolineae bacterium]